MVDQGTASYQRLVTTPKDPAPPPRNAQNSPLSDCSLQMVVEPSAYLPFGHQDVQLAHAHN